MKRKIFMIISIISLLLVGCSDTNNQKKKVEFTEEQNELDKGNLDKKDIEHHVPYANFDTGKIDVEIINQRYRNVNKDELNYDTIEIESIVKEHNVNPDNMTKIYISDQIKGDTSYKTILEGYSYKSEGNVFNFTYEDAIELVKKVLPDDIEEVDYILNKELNTECKYYTSSKGNFRVDLSYTNSFNDKDIDEIHKDAIIAISYSKEFE